MTTTSVNDAGRPSETGRGPSPRATRSRARLLSSFTWSWYATPRFFAPPAGLSQAEGRGYLGAMARLGLLHDAAGVLQVRAALAKARQ